MAETSWPWDSTVTGDATTAPYSASEYAQFVRTTMNEGVSGANSRFHITASAFGYGSLLVTGTATPVSVAAGYAQIAGFTYLNTATETLAVSTPGANPRVDRVVLRIDWAAQTIRLALLAGTPAASPTPPALTQTIGTTYEVSLAQVYITTGGVITVRDERVGVMGLGPETYFRDIKDRVLEEFFENFSGRIPATAYSAEQAWYSAVSSGTIAGASGESAVQLNTTATNSRSAEISWGNTGSTVFRGLELSKAPILFEARMAFSAAADAQSQFIMSLESAAGGDITFGQAGSLSTTNLVGLASNGGTTSFVTAQAADLSGAYHTYAITLAAAAGPAVFWYDGVPIGQVAANIPASTTDLRAMFYVQNGTTAADRVLKVDWARYVRGTN